MCSKLYLAWILAATVISPIYACRHNLVPENTAVTFLEIFLSIFVTLFFIILCFLLPRVASCFCEIREMNVERRRRFQAYRKLQSSNQTQVHVPIHFLRDYYEQKRKGNSSETFSGQRIQPLI